MNAVSTMRRVLEQIRHDPRTIGLLLVVPSLLVGLMSWIFSAADTPPASGTFDRVGPALIAIFPFTIMFLVTSIATLRERRSGTLERLMTLPISKFDFILGYAGAFGILAIAQAAITVGFAIWICGLTIEGSIWMLLAVAALDGLLGTALGLLASAFARTEFQVVQFMPVVVIPQFLLGGVLLARDQMPDALAVVSDWLPLSHAVNALNAIARDDRDVSYILGEMLFVAVVAIAAILLGAITLRRRTT